MALTKAQEKEKQKHIRYWTRRETEQKKHNITEEAEYSKELQKIYDNMLDNVQKEIDAFYGKYAKQNNITLAEAKKAVSELDIKAYERKAKRYVKEKNFSKEANEEMRLYNLTMKINRLEMLKANIGLEMIAGHDELEKFMEDILKGRTMDELERQAGILGKTIKNNAQTANAIVNASFHNAKFSDRIWMHQDLLKNDLNKLLQSGLIAGKNPRVLAKEIKQRFEVKTSDAERLMRTELARVQTEAQKQSFERNGFTQYTFLALGDACPICADINGKHFKVADMMPGLNASPLHPFCRCSVAAYEDDEEYNAWLDYLEAGGTTAEWEKTGLKMWKKSGKVIVNNSQNSTIELEEQIANADAEIEELKKQFSDITEGYSYEDWFKDFKTIEDGYGDITEEDKPNVIKLKDISKKLKKLIKQKNQLIKQLPALGTQGAPMNITDALKGANPNYSSGNEYKVNCQRCVQAYELRRRGYDVEAMPKPKRNNSVVWGNECFVDSAGNTPSFTFRLSKKDIEDTLQNAPDGSRHIIYIAWANSRDAHVFIAEKENGVVRYVDPQPDKNDVSSYLARGKSGRFGILRVDDKDITKDSKVLKATVRR